MGAAFVRGAQHHVLSDAKHYAVNDIENARFTVDERTLREVQRVRRVRLARGRSAHRALRERRTRHRDVERQFLRGIQANGGTRVRRHRPGQGRRSRPAHRAKAARAPTDDRPVAPTLDVVGGAEHAALALDVEREAIVLLKNEGKTLPLDRQKVQRVAVVGTFASIARLGDKGSSSVTPGHARDAHQRAATALLR